jgi:hypothetical protein
LFNGYVTFVPQKGGPKQKAHHFGGLSRGEKVSGLCAEGLETDSSAQSLEDAPLASQEKKHCRPKLHPALFNTLGRICGVSILISAGRSLYLLRFTADPELGDLNIFIDKHPSRRHYFHETSGPQIPPAASASR